MTRTYTVELERAAADIAFRDDLTGLLNRRFLSDLLDRWWDALAAEHGRISLLMIDLDGFKAVNDRFGHMVGDDVLRVTAGVLRGAFRGEDIVVRYGGDEFVAVLPGTPHGEAQRLAERARLAMKELRSGRGGLPREVARLVSFSIGAACVPDDARGANEALALADARLLEAKWARRPRAGWPARLGLALAAATLLAAVVAVLAGRLSDNGASRLPSTAETPGAGGAETGGEAGEAELLAEIARLRAELAAQQRRERAREGNVSDVTLEALRARIATLERELERVDGGATATAPAASSSPAAAGSVGEAAGEDFPVAGTSTPPPASDSPPSPARPSPTVTPPVLQRYEQPAYPDAARRLRREADVALRVWVNADGRVTRVEPSGAPVGLGLDEAARVAAFSARYTPARVDGRAVSAQTVLVIQFRLAESR